MEATKHALTFERSTKRFHVYADPSGRFMSKIYVSQEDAGTNPPARIVVTVEEYGS